MVGVPKHARRRPFRRSLSRYLAHKSTHKIHVLFYNTLFYKTYIHVSGVSSGGGGVVRSFFADGGDSGRVCLWMLERFRFSKKNSGGR